MKPSDPFDYDSEDVSEGFTEWVRQGAVPEPQDDQQYKTLRRAFTAGMNAGYDVALCDHT